MRVIVTEKDREEKTSIIFTLDESCRFGQQ